MENRKDSLSVLKICRFCLTQDDTLTNIYDRHSKPKKAVNLSLKILSCLSVEVFPSDRLPAYICKPCIFFMELFFKYKEICRKADESLMLHIQKGNSLEQIPWPGLLTKIYRFGSKVGLVHTVVDGATVQLTSQYGTDSEDDDDDDANIYSIKIDDESGEGSKRIQLISSNEDKGKSQVTKAKPEDLSYEADSDEEDGIPVKLAKKRGCWPCEECHCTFPLQQLLRLHKNMKHHRPRTFPCDMCDKIFLTKHDLATHQLHHSDDMPYQCVACEKKFKRLADMKKHEKIIHPDIPQLACPNCPATFLSLEELNAHSTRHGPFPCAQCSKKFADKSRLQRHTENVHQTPAFRCEYCPAHYSAISKLMKHVRTHAGSRSYPCKYCDKTFIKSHHYTRHLRVKHRGAGEVIRPRAPAPSNAEQYRCEQCSEAFDSQDELIYHSAIHATQNLTCPLCQEKFDDVDAVTAHIKSHVNGMEFMCDLCELVFTSKEKLDKHLAAAHAEELEQDDSAMEAKSEEDDEDETGINLTEENGEMIVEIKKTDNFMKQLPEGQDQANAEENMETALFEENEAEPTYTELATVDTLALKQPPIKTESDDNASPIAEDPATISKVTPKPVEPVDSQTAHILRKAEEVKRKVRQITAPLPEKKAKVESSNSVSGASDKSLRLLEKELQELKRTNTRTEVTKTPAKPMENLRNRRPQIHTSTPKTRAVEQKKETASAKTPTVEKKVIERRIVTKENKEPKEAKDTKTNAPPVKEDKTTREEKKDDVKEKETPKNVVKNGANEKSQPEENVRRSTRPSKIKDYAKMIRDKSQDSDDDSDDPGDEEYKEAEKNEKKTRRSSIKTPAGKGAAAPPAPAAPPARKRGRPRKEQPKEVPAKMKKDDVEEDEEQEKETDKSETEPTSKKSTAPDEKEKQTEDKSATSEPKDTTATATGETASSEQKASPGRNLLMSPSGQTLKKVPIRSLPPGVKPLPLPTHARPMGPGELCEMQIGQKVVKVQKIVMTKAEVEAMAKKGLVEMKDGTMVLKQGIKLPTSELSSLVPNLGGKGISKESPKTEKASNTTTNAQSNTNE